MGLNAYPNPFNPNTTVQFSVAEAGSVTLNVYNISGQMVSTLVDADLTAGAHQVDFYAGNLPSGVYFAQLTSGDMTQSTRLVLLK